MPSKLCSVVTAPLDVTSKTVPSPLAPLEIVVPQKLPSVPKSSMLGEEPSVPSKLWSTVRAPVEVMA